MVRRALKGAGGWWPDAPWRTRAVVVVGVLVSAALLDYSLGWALDSARPGTDEKATLPAVTKGSTTDPRAASPAMSGSPWAARHFADLKRIPYEYWSFVERKPQVFDAPGLHVRGWRRTSASAPSSRRAIPTVWVLGGSVAFGVGQRDEHTIASELARLASKAGRSIAVENFGQLDSVHFNEVIEYEQLLAERPDPAFALFLDGAADVQAQAAFDQPTASLLRTQGYSIALNGKRIETTVATPDTPSLGPSLWTTYRDHSLVAKGLRATGLIATAAGAEPEPPDQTAALLSSTVGRNAAEVYERGQFLTRTLSRRHGVSPMYFWQPIGLDLPAFTAARSALPERTIDLAGVLDDRREVFIDGVDVNEEGAKLIALAMWKDLEPKVIDWYRSHGG